MLGVMSDDTSDASKDFLTTGRVGRRNAMADILSDHALTTTSDLPEKLNMCTISEGNPKSCEEEEKPEQDSAHVSESAPKPES